jgi:hypothetical protein
LLITLHRAIIGKKEEAMEWIRVKDRLPEHNGRIVVLIGNQEFLGKCGSVSALYVTYDGYPTPKNPSIMFEIGFGWKLPGHFKTPSHWLPLPNHPIGGSHGI